jgi:N-acetylglutamate synthase-like GNAT family acetyltransferase
MNEPFSLFWTQGEKAALCKLDDTMILDANGADFDEIKDFIAMTGSSQLLCDFRAAQSLGLPVTAHGEIMVYHNRTPVQQPVTFELNPSLREIHALLTACATDTFIAPEFEPFYMDISHRIRHDTAVTVGVRQGETLVSCAVCSAQTENSAVLSAIAVSPDHRRKGFGYAVLSALLSQLPQENIYIFRAQNENEEFYKKFGFLPSGEFAELAI